MGVVGDSGWSDWGVLVGQGTLVEGRRGPEDAPVGVGSGDLERDWGDLGQATSAVGGQGMRQRVGERR